MSTLFSSPGKWTAFGKEMAQGKHRNVSACHHLPQGWGRKEVLGPVPASGVDFPVRPLFCSKLWGQRGSLAATSLDTWSGRAIGAEARFSLDGELDGDRWDLALPLPPKHVSQGSAGRTGLEGSSWHCIACGCDNWPASSCKCFPGQASGDKQLAVLMGVHQGRDLQVSKTTLGACHPVGEDLATRRTGGRWDMSHGLQGESADTCLGPGPSNLLGPLPAPGKPLQKQANPREQPSYQSRESMTGSLMCENMTGQQQGHGWGLCLWGHFCFRTW